MSQIIIKLKQVESIDHRPQGSTLKGLEQGDKFGGFEVINLEEQECKHPERHWSLDEKFSGSTPTITGKCRICGHEKKAVPQVESQQ